MHEDQAAQSASLGRRATAAESYLRAAIYYHYGKHLFASPPEEFDTRLPILRSEYPMVRSSVTLRRMFCQEYNRESIIRLALMPIKGEGEHESAQCAACSLIDTRQ